MNARKIAAIAKMSLEVSQDSIVGLGAFLLQLFAEKIAGLEDQQACEGNGVGGNFMGLFTVAGTGAVSVAGALTNVDPFITALRETLPMVAQPNATWVMHPKLWGRIQKLKDSQNQYLLNPAPTGDIPMSLLGRPVKLTDQISVTRGSGNDTTAYVGDFARGMLFGDRMRMELGINPFVDWGTAQISVRVIERVGILVGIPRAFVKLTGITVA
jgi:HK97 family phage major capsid protein